MKKPDVNTQMLAALKRVKAHEQWKEMLSEESRAASYLDMLDKVNAAIDAAEAKLAKKGPR